MLFEDLPEAGKVEVLVVLEEDEAEVELREGQLEVLHLPGRDVQLGEECEALPVSQAIAVLVLRRLEVRLEGCVLSGCLGHLLCIGEAREMVVSGCVELVRQQK